MRWFLGILLVVVFFLALRWAVYTVDASEYVYVTRLGKHVATFNGADPQGAGLHVGWPWPLQVAQRLDRRLQHFDLDSTELLTHDSGGKTIDKTLTVQAYVCWRIADQDGVERFIQRLGTPEQARAFLGQRINSQLGAAIGQMGMDDLVSTKAGREPGQSHVDEKMRELQDRLMSELKEPVLREYGIDLVDIRLRRFSHPADVRAAIFDRIRSERSKKAAEYRSKGEKQAKDIESEGEEKVRSLLAEARYQEERLKGQADTEAALVRNQAHSQDPDFYAFLKKMEKLQNILGDNKTVLLLSSHRPLFDLLFNPPGSSGQFTASPPGTSPSVAMPQPKNGTVPVTPSPERMP